MVELEKESTECARYKEEVEKANAKIKELEEQLQEAVVTATMVEEKGKKEMDLLKQTHEERENSLLEKIRKLEAELETLKLQHQLDTKGKQLYNCPVILLGINPCIYSNITQSLRG